MNKKQTKKENNKLKEYLYIDKALVDSLLSQIEGGLVSAITKTEQTVHGNTYQNNTEKGVSGSLMGASASGKYNKSHGQSDQTLNSFSFNTIYYDYAVDVLEQELNLSLVTDTGSAFENDFILSRNDFEIFNFSELENIMDMSSFKEILEKNSGLSKKELDKQSNLLNDGVQILGDINYIKLDKNLIIPKNENFRISEAQLQLFKNSNRKLTVLGIVESKLSRNFFDVSLSSSISVTNLKSIAVLKMLKGLDVIQENSRLILPIALYFK